MLFFRVVLYLFFVDTTRNADESRNGKLRQKVVKCLGRLAGETALREFLFVWVVVEARFRGYHTWDYQFFFFLT